MKMRLALAALLLTSTSAFAADLAPQAVEPVAPVVAPVYNWTGFYAGVHAGAAIGQGKIDHAKLNGTGFLGGVHAGYNAQFDGGWVVGLETDIDYSSVKKSKAVTDGDIVTRATLKNEWQGSTRARFGYAFDNILPYVTGGVAYGNVKTSIAGVGSKTDTRVGWTAGAGVEYAIDQNWIVRGEARYVDLGDKSSTFGGTRHKVKFNSTDLTLGVSYKF
ncbi:outer membrane protein [Labrys sp. ZIDIC5]|uniref:outer membrane protein n=1 Tax=Labrys sedimenti TaxID=3106036 RepID=UPI002ACA29F7|nr:outer membrane protein [Labrys sp. ZIDIC5]MDZ5450639.1 outer membrane protein [Labrys sp. ZIDIC5]